MLSQLMVSLSKIFFWFAPSLFLNIFLCLILSLCLFQMAHRLKPCYKPHISNIFGGLVIVIVDSFFPFIFFSAIVSARAREKFNSVDLCRCFDAKFVVLSGGVETNAIQYRLKSDIIYTFCGMHTHTHTAENLICCATFFCFSSHKHTQKKPNQMENTEIM